MAVWPSYARFILTGAGEEFDPSVERTEMERGLPKQRIVNSDVMATISGAVLFTSDSDIASFEQWYFQDVGRVGFFEFRHPRTGTLVQARFVNGQLGRLEALSGGFAIASREVMLEYVRQAL